MRMMIRYQSGRRVEAGLLAANRERMRVAICSQGDTIELHRVDAGWRTQRGAAIEIEALLAIPGAAHRLSEVIHWQESGQSVHQSCFTLAFCALPVYDRATGGLRSGPKPRWKRRLATLCPLGLRGLRLGPLLRPLGPDY